LEHFVLLANRSPGQKLGEWWTNASFRVPNFHEEAMMLADHTGLACAQLQPQTGIGNLLGESVEMQSIYKLIEKVSQYDFPVLILGESGTGKELVARAIHCLGERANRPFTPVDCAALTPSLIESELFGHTKGSFTGATNAKPGLFEVAHRGTIFLDEIGELPVHLQAKLLRVLQERAIRPVGSTSQIPINVRVIAATNRDLESAVRSGTFRQDLYFRLNVVQINMPPLRRRKSDIPLLANHFLGRFADHHVPMRAISEGAMERLLNYDWPGNVRELENIIQQALALGSDTAVQASDLPPSLEYAPARCVSGRTGEAVDLENLERLAISRALRETGGGKLAAARLLGIGKTTLYRKLKLYGSEFH
jgi:transcriptional regulator with PAS, ATPase and Fis domain